MARAKTIREQVQTAAARLNLTAYRLAKLADGAVSEDTVKNYLEGRKDTTSEVLDAILPHLGLGVVRRT